MTLDDFSRNYDDFCVILLTIASFSARTTFGLSTTPHFSAEESCSRISPSRHYFLTIFTSFIWRVETRHSPFPRHRNAFSWFKLHHATFGGWISPFPKANAIFRVILDVLKLVRNSFFFMWVLPLSRPLSKKFFLLELSDLSLCSRISSSSSRTWYFS